MCLEAVVALKANPHRAGPVPRSRVRGRGRRLGSKIAMDVDEGGLFGEPVGDLVGGDVDVLVQVDDRLHGDLGLGVGAPVPDLVGVHEGVGVLHPGQVQVGGGCA